MTLRERENQKAVLPTGKKVNVRLGISTPTVYSLSQSFPSRLKRVFIGLSFIETPGVSGNIDEFRRQHRVFFGICHTLIYLNKVILK